MSGDVDGGGRSASAVAADLRTLVALSTPGAVRRAELPALRSVAGADPAPIVDTAVAAITERTYRHAAEALLGSGDGRWQTLERRGQRAAEALGLTTYDALRRPRRSTGTSHLEEILELVADGVVGGRTEPVAAAGPWARVRRHPSAVIAAVVVGILALVAVVALVLGRGSGKRSTAAPQLPLGTRSTTTVATACAARVGDLPRDAPPDLTPYVAAFRMALRAEPQECASAPIERWEQLVLEHLQRGGHADGVVIARDPGHVLRLTEAEFQSYHQLGGKTGDRAQPIEGLPLMLSTDHRATILRTENGGVVSEGPDQPGYYVGSTVWDTWQADGGPTSRYGLPTSNPLFDGNGYHQDFETGTFYLPFTGVLRFEVAADPAAALPPDPNGHILRHDDATTWYVDADGVRHWIPDGSTYVCLERTRHATQIAGVPGYAIATLPLGPPATCA